MGGLLRARCGVVGACCVAFQKKGIGIHHACVEENEGWNGHLWLQLFCMMEQTLPDFDSFCSFKCCMQKRISLCSGEQAVEIQFSVHVVHSHGW